jgi:hypothetical protein
MHEEGNIKTNAARAAQALRKKQRKANAFVVRYKK